MQSSLIDPSWIVEGDPQARVASVSRSADGQAWTDLWDCTAGRFRWHYAIDETIHILEGGATVVDQDGKTWTLTPGSTVTFHAGTAADWHVPTYVRKVAFCHNPTPYSVRTIMKIARRLRSRKGRAAIATAIAMAATMTALELAELL